jgi:methionyl-tRNA formyltransferase
VRVLFFGTPQLAVPTLAAVAEHHEVVGVVCQPDKPQGRSKKLVPPAVKTWALDHHLVVQQPSKLNDGNFEKWVVERAPEIGVLVAYGRLLKPPILAAFPQGILNLHPSLLPKFRGPAPITGALVQGETVTGVTIMRLSDEMDAGDILLQEKVTVEDNEDAESLTSRLADIGAALMVKALNLVARGEAQYTPQDHDKATHTTLLEKTHGRIQWSQPAEEIHNLVRGCTPWPGGQCLWKGLVCRIFATRVIEDSTHAAPGTVVHVEKNEIVVATGGGQLAIGGIQLPGKRAMAMADFLPGHDVEPGDTFGTLA